MPFSNRLTVSELLAPEAVQSYHLSANLQSDNYQPGAAGWRIERDTGDAEFQDVTVRGAVFASSGEIVGLLISGGVQAGSLTVDGTLLLRGTGAMFASGTKTDFPRVELAHTDEVIFYPSSDPAAVWHMRTAADLAFEILRSNATAGFRVTPDAALEVINRVKANWLQAHGVFSESQYFGVATYSGEQVPSGGTWSFAHGIAEGHRRILAAYMVYTGASNEATPGTINWISGTHVNMTAGRTNVPYRLTLHYRRTSDLSWPA